MVIVKKKNQKPKKNLSKKLLWPVHGTMELLSNYGNVHTSRAESVYHQRRPDESRALKEASPLRVAFIQSLQDQMTSKFLSASFQGQTFHHGDGIVHAHFLILRKRMAFIMYYV